MCRPDIFVALSDGETPFGAANKRVTKAVSKSLDFLDVCLKRKQEDKDALEDTKIFGAVQGGYEHIEV